MFLLLSACYNPTLFVILWRHAMKHQPIGFAFVTIRWFGMETWDHPELRSAGTDCHVFIHPSPPSLPPSSPSLLPPPPPCPPASFSFAPGNEFPRRRLHSAGDWRVKRADGCVGKRSALTWQNTRVSRGGKPCARPGIRWHERSCALRDFFVDHTVHVSLVATCASCKMCNRLLLFVMAEIFYLIYLSILEIIHSKALIVYSSLSTE